MLSGVAPGGSKQASESSRWEPGRRLDVWQKRVVHAQVTAPAMLAHGINILRVGALSSGGHNAKCVCAIKFGPLPVSRSQEQTNRCSPLKREHTRCAMRELLFKFL